MLFNIDDSKNPFFIELETIRDSQISKSLYSTPCTIHFPTDLCEVLYYHNKHRNETKHEKNNKTVFNVQINIK